MGLSKKEIKNLSELLISADGDNVQVALEIIKGAKEPNIEKMLATELYALYKIGVESKNDSRIYRTINWDHHREIETILKRIDDADVQNAVKSKLGVVVGFKMRANLKKLTTNTILDPKRIALIIFNKCNLGLDYLTAELEDDEIRPILLRFKKDNVFDISRKRLNKIPKVFFEFTDLEYVNFNNNLIKTIPKEIAKLTKLKYLDMSWSPLTKVNPAISKLKHLEILDLASTNLKPDEQKKLNALGVKINWEANTKNTAFHFFRK